MQATCAHLGACCQQPRSPEGLLERRRVGITQSVAQQLPAYIKSLVQMNTVRHYAWRVGIAQRVTQQLLPCM